LLNGVSASPASDATSAYPSPRFASSLQPDWSSPSLPGEEEGLH